ncbi:MAG: GIY-YIG nuclease family protein, partial [Christensenellales bacterium]
MFSEKLKNLPEEPGVYLMLDEAGEIIYVGKAKSLKNRVRQYFQFSGNKTAKVQAMVSKIADFRYILTRTEVEALVLESNLIKKHAPKYNILLKDDKNYPFLKLNLKEEFPRLEVVRTLKNDGSKYFGPYMNGISVKDILELIGSAFPLRVCAYDFSKSRPARPCLNYHIGRCLAPCSGKVDAVEYRRAV